MDPLEIALINSTKPSAIFEPQNITGKKIVLNGVSQLFLHQLNITKKFDRSLIINNLRNLEGHHIQHNGYYKAGKVKGLLPYFSNTEKVHPKQVSYRTGLHKIDVQEYEIIYAIGDMQIEVMSISFNEKAQIQKATLEKPALYRVTRDNDDLWKITRHNVQNIDTKYAAVNGQSNNLEKATWLMGRYLEHHYSKSQVKEYTLFHNPSEGGKRDTWESNRDKLGGALTTPISKLFSKTLEESQALGKPIKWIAHSQGTIIYTQAVNYYNKGRSGSSLIGAYNKFKDKNYTGSLNQHSVTFQGTGAHVNSARRILNKAGIELLAEKSHRYDAVYQVAGLNCLSTGDAVGAIGSLVYAKHTLKGTIGQSPHTFYRGDAQWKACMENDPHGKGYTAMQRVFNKVEPTATSMQLAAGQLTSIMNTLF
jgi:hypothetical protein